MEKDYQTRTYLSVYLTKRAPIFQIFSQMLVAFVVAINIIAYGQFELWRVFHERFIL